MSSNLIQTLNSKEYENIAIWALIKCIDCFPLKGAFFVTLNPNNNL